MDTDVQTQADWREWALRGWMELFGAHDLERGPYTSEQCLRLLLPDDAPDWLRTALSDELIRDDWDGS